MGALHSSRASILIQILLQATALTWGEQWGAVQGFPQLQVWQWWQLTSFGLDTRLPPSPFAL